MGWGLIDLKRWCGVDESAFAKQMPDVSGICTTQNPGEPLLQNGRKIDPDHTDAVAEEPIHTFGPMGQLVDHQDVDFGALIFVDVPLVLGVAEINLTFLLFEPDFVVNDRHPLLDDPRREQHSETLRSLQMIFDQVVANTAEKIYMQPSE